MLGGRQYYGLVAGLREPAPDAVAIGSGAGVGGTSGGSGGKSFDAGAVYGDIRRGLSREDRRAAGLLWSLTDIYGLPRERIEWLYTECARAKSEFLRRWGEFDRELRTAIAARTLPLFETADLVQRERAIDLIRWEKADELAEFDTFGMPAILAYLVKVGIVGRWAALDLEVGREMYGRLLGEMEMQAKNRE